jgi:hypothetical protein
MKLLVEGKETLETEVPLAREAGQNRADGG